MIVVSFGGGVLRMKENKIIHATLVKANRDFMGDLESFVIKDDSGKRRTVTVQQVETALQKNLIEIKGLRLTAAGNVKETRRPHNKRPVSKEKKELESLEKKIDKLANSKDSKDKDAYYKLIKKEISCYGRRHIIMHMNQFKEKFG